MKGSPYMKAVKIIKNKIPLIITLFCCFVVAALSASVKVGQNNAAQASVNASPKKIIVLDAGHYGCALSIVT